MTKLDLLKEEFPSWKVESSSIKDIYNNVYPFIRVDCPGIMGIFWDVNTQQQDDEMRKKLHERRKE